LGIYSSLTEHVNVEIGTEAVQFPHKEYINGMFVAIFVAVIYLNVTFNVLYIERFQATKFTQRRPLVPMQKVCR
jgi:hypothetical protein